MFFFNHRAALLRWLVLCFACAAMQAAAPLPARAQSQREYKIKAAYLYHLCRYITWPEGSFEAKTSPIVIAIVGKNPFEPSTLQKIGRKKAGARRIKFVEFDAWNEQCANCHIIFVSKTSPDVEKDVLIKGCKLPVLVVTEGNGPDPSGAAVNFKMRANTTIAIQIDIRVINRLNFKVNAKLLKLAEVIGGVANAAARNAGAGAR